MAHNYGHTNKLVHKRGGDVIWAPQPGSQTAFLTCPFPEVLYEGTRGPGKTDALIMSFCQFVGRGFGEAWRGILFRETYKQLVDVINKSRKWIPKIWPQALYNATEHYWKFPNGEVLYLRQFKREADYLNYHGHEYPWIGWEELCNWASPSGYKQMMSTNRSSHKEVPRFVRSTTNPYGPGHNWVKKRFRLSTLPLGGKHPIIDDEYDDKGNREPTRVAIHGSIYENKILLEADPGYIQRLRVAARNPAELAAWLEGSWDIVAGGMFDDVWSPDHHIIKPFPIPKTFFLNRSFDWGSSRPFSVGWWAKSDGSPIKVPGEPNLRRTLKGDIFRIAEWYGQDPRKRDENVGLKMLAVDIAKGIVERELKWGLQGKVNPGPADSSIFDVENGNCIADDMARTLYLQNKPYPGVHWIKADKSPGSRKNGWEMFRKYLSRAIPPQNGQPREGPGLFVFDTCRDGFIRTVPSLPRDQRDLDDVDTDAEDHTADETRYLLRKIGNATVSTPTIGLH